MIPAHRESDGFVDLRTEQSFIPGYWGAGEEERVSQLPGSPQVGCGFRSVFRDLDTVLLFCSLV